MVKKFFIKKSKPTYWYYNFVGKTIEVFEKEIHINDKIGYEYIKKPNHIIYSDDCLSNEELRKFKINRILKQN